MPSTLSIGAGRLIAAQLYGVFTWDPMALGIAAGALAIAAFFRRHDSCAPCGLYFTYEGAEDGVER